MHTPRRFFLAFVGIAVGIAVPMTLKPSAATLAVLWALIALALLGALVTWQPVARRVPYRVVSTVDPQAAADAALAAECAQLAGDIHAWIEDHDLMPGAVEEGWETALKMLPPAFTEEFDGRLFITFDKLVKRGCVTRDDMRDRIQHRSFLPASFMLEDVHVLEGWARKLRHP